MNKDVKEFIDNIPKNIEWVKTIKDELEDVGVDDEFYDSFFDIWKELDYTPDLQPLAAKANTIVYDTLTNHKPLYKHYENALSYELGDDAKRFYWVACDIYNYVIWLQDPDRFPDKTRLYCEKIYNKWIKPYP